jgi:hypothetical protein
MGVGEAKRGSMVAVGLGGGVLVSVGRIKWAVGTCVSTGVETAVEVKLAGVIYPVLHIRVVPSSKQVNRIRGIFNLITLMA